MHIIINMCTVCYVYENVIPIHQLLEIHIASDFSIPRNLARRTHSHLLCLDNERFDSRN